MKMDKVANSGNDEFYTPLYAIKPIEKYLEKESKIWCPFDLPDSYFVKYMEHKGHQVLCSHIDRGEDFFELIDSEICDWADYIISNPPYSLKTEVLDSLFNSGKRFAMLLGIVGLFESQSRFEMFRDNPFEIMYFNRRISYMSDYESGKTVANPPFSSAYITSGILPRTVVFEEIDKKDIKFEIREEVK